MSAEVAVGHVWLVCRQGNLAKYKQKRGNGQPGSRGDIVAERQAGFLPNVAY